ncbi:MAG: alanine racemase [Treponema sp.]|nr:alanine racemase [Treponema sp.]
MRTEAVIYLNRFKDNINAVKARIGKERRICVPVKANGYGHGALKIAKKSLEYGAYCLGVATVKEGIELRKGGIKAPVLLFSQPHPDEIPEILEARLSPFLSDIEFTSILNSLAGKKKIKLPVHLKIDTGMGRIGCPVNEAASLAKHIKKCAALELTGTATHLAVSDSADSNDINYTAMQLKLFKKAIAAIKNAGVNPGIVHAANSGAVILHPEAWFDMVRPGILLYGYKAADEYELPLASLKKMSKFKALQIEPVMELKSTVTLIKKIKKGETVSYGRTWTVAQDTFIAIIPTGYGDGFPRLASGRWQVEIGGELYPVAGRICMDQCCIDIGPKPGVQRWDEVIIFGSRQQTADEIIIRQSAADLAKAVRTIPYEITCNINRRVPRVYKE